LDEGDPCFLLRNISKASGLVKARRYWAFGVNQPVVVVKLDTKEGLRLSPILMEKVSDGIRFARWQVPIRLIYAGTVHGAKE
jgi:hypothetical protein